MMEHKSLSPSNRRADLDYEWLRYSKTYFGNNKDEDKYEDPAIPDLDEIDLKPSKSRHVDNLKLQAATNILMAFRRNKIEEFIDESTNKNDDILSDEYDYIDGLDLDKRKFLRK